jgi:hypothetical protein
VSPLNMDVFRGDAFTMQELTHAVIDMPYVPRRIGELGIFEYQGVPTTEVLIEKQNNQLRLVQTTPRGGVAVQRGRNRRNMISVPTSRIALESPITADEIQNVRELGTNQLVTLASTVNQRNITMSQDIEATMEYHRMGALRGLVVDADGDELINAYELFGLTPPDAVDFDLDNASPDSGALRQKCTDVIRAIEDALGDVPYSGVYGLCSSGFYDAVGKHKEYLAAHANTERGAEALTGRLARRRINYGGITFEEYRGTVGGTAYVEENSALFFPVGAPGFLLGRFAPAEWWDTVNTIGLPRYSRIIIDPRFADSQVTTHVQTQPLHICTRPLALIPATLNDD